MDFSSPDLRSTLDRLRTRFGALADPWWEQVPALIDQLADRWDLRIDGPVGRGNTSLVVRCTRGDGSPAILKMAPEPALTEAEATALRSWASSRRVPEVWEVAEDRGAILLEAIADETPVGETRSSLPLHEVGALIRGLHDAGTAEVGGGVTPLAGRIDFMFMFGLWRRRQSDEPAQPVSFERVQRGYELGRSLAASARSDVLLHGDLHPWNVLDGGAERGLVAIDPRACVGDPAFDGIDWVVIWPKDDPANWERRCSGVADEIRVDADRLWDWCRTFAAMLADSEYARDGETDRFAAFMEMAP